MSDNEISNITSFSCTIKGNILDSYYDKIDETQCFILHFADIFYTLNLGNICILFSISIILISIFGDLKEDYRWFLLNQSIWDILISLKYFCDSDLYYFTTAFETPKCELFGFAGEYQYLVPISEGSEYGYLYTGIRRMIEVYFSSIVQNMPYSALFLLTFSRFFAIFFGNFYEKITKNHRLFYTIIFFNLFNLILNIGSIFDMLIQNYIHDLHRKYNVPPLVIVYYQKDFEWPFNCSSINCFYEKDTILMILYVLNDILTYFNPGLKFFYMLFSMISSIILIIRIGIQAKFQLKHNRRDFFISFRISSAIFFQTFLLAVLFFISFISTLPNLMIMIFRVDVQTSLWSCPSDSLNCIDLSLPAWIDGQYGLMSDAVQSTIRQFRILLECFFILFIMAGYYESVKLCLKFCYFFIRNPKNAYSKFKASTLSSKVVPFSSNARSMN